MTSVTNRPSTEVPNLEMLQRRNRLLSVTVVVLALAVVGVIVWAIATNGDTSEVAAPAAVEQLIDDYFEAANDYDAETIAEIFTDELLVYTARTLLARDSAGVLNPRALSVASWNESSRQSALDVYGAAPLGEFETVALGEPVVVGDGPWFVAQAWWEDTPNDASHPDGVDGITTYTVVDDEGTLKIARVVSLFMPIE